MSSRYTFPFIRSAPRRFLASGLRRISPEFSLTNKPRWQIGDFQEFFVCKIVHHRLISIFTLPCPGNNPTFNPASLDGNIGPLIRLSQISLENYEITWTATLLHSPSPPVLFVRQSNPSPWILILIVTSVLDDILNLLQEHDFSPARFPIPQPSNSISTIDSHANQKEKSTHTSYLSRTHGRCPWRKNLSCGEISNFCT